jgi:peptidoglycan/xylan/chitin deacetylase (PgdA/CDA1 family)
MLNVLMYHKLYTDGNKDKNSHSISVKNFKNQIKTLSDKDCISLEDGDIFNKDDNKEYYAITFDDGAESDYKLAFNILKKYNIKASFYIITNKINSKGCLSKNEIIQMYKYGMNIGSHTHSHAKLSLLNSHEIYQELYKSKKILEDILGSKVISISVPGGFYNDEVISIAKEIGYEIILTSDIGFNNFKSNILKRNAIKENMNFSKVLNSGLYLKIFALRYSLLKIIKKLIGNKSYEKIKLKIRKIIKL